MKQSTCIHIDNPGEFKDPSDLCDECIKTSGSWVHLRTCQTCGITLCCDNSPNKHMSAHFKETGHPLVISAQEGERWMWCYEHQMFAKY
jgi:hypothetical protein